MAKKRRDYNRQLENATKTVLCNDYASELKSSFFRWSPDMLAAIKAEYENLGGQGGLEHKFSDNKWRGRAVRSARNSLNIGIVLKKSNGGDIGDITREQSSIITSSKFTKGAKNTTDGLGPLKIIQLSAEMLGRIVEFAEARRLDESTPVPLDLMHIFPVGDELAAAVGAKGDLDGVLSIVEGVFKAEMNVTADQIDDMKHDDIDPFVDAFMAKNFGYLDTNSKEYEEEAGIRKYVLHMIKCRLTSVKEMLLEGKACLLPIKIEDSSLSTTKYFNAVFTVVRIRQVMLSFIVCLFDSLLTYLRFRVFSSIRRVLQKTSLNAVHLRS